MLDRETGLYYRDAKYVYPKHKTSSGKKDFWARGDGWAVSYTHLIQRYTFFDDNQCPHLPFAHAHTGKYNRHNIRSVSYTHLMWMFFGE